MEDNTMTHNEIQLIKMLREAPDTARAMETAADILSRCAAGESLESIAASYGLDLAAI